MKRAKLDVASSLEAAPRNSSILTPDKAFATGSLCRKAKKIVSVRESMQQKIAAKRAKRDNVVSRSSFVLGAFIGKIKHLTKKS